MQNNELLPCKECGITPDSFNYNWAEYCWIRCDCGICSEVVDTLENAIIDWNIKNKVENNLQPSPIKNTSKPIWDLVIDDMVKRDQTGRERYGTPLQAFNGRDALQDAYEEALDLAVYLRQAIEERKNDK